MDLGKYIGINYDKTYTTYELGNIFSKFNNLHMKDYRINHRLDSLLGKQSVSTIIKFIDMFKDINEFEARGYSSDNYSLAGNILLMISNVKINNKTYVYIIMDHLLKKNMNTSIICVNTTIGRVEYNSTNYIYYFNNDNQKTVTYMLNNYNVIQNVRKIINNYNMILFDITDDLQFIESILLVSKSRHKNLPKFIITQKILFWYLLCKNYMYNKD